MTQVQRQDKIWRPKSSYEIGSSVMWVVCRCGHVDRQTDSWGPHTSLRWHTLLSMSRSLKPSEHQTAEVSLEASQCPVFHLIFRESVMFVFFSPENQIICFVLKSEVGSLLQVCWHVHLLGSMWFISRVEYYKLTYPTNMTCCKAAAAKLRSWCSLFVFYEYFSSNLQVICTTLHSIFHGWCLSINLAGTS